MDSTTILLRRIWDGDDRAREELARAYLPVLKRLAHGRIPPSARGLIETGDVVSIALYKAMTHIQEFRPRREGALLCWMRQILFNEIRDAIRRARVRPSGGELDENLASQEPTPLERLIGAELVGRYEAALAHLTPNQSEAAVLRLEFGMSYGDIAEKMDLDSPDAARMLVSRALVRLAKELREQAAGADDKDGAGEVSPKPADGGGFAGGRP